MSYNLYVGRNGKEHYQVKEIKRRKACRRLNQPQKPYVGQPSKLSLFSFCCMENSKLKN